MALDLLSSEGNTTFETLEEKFTYPDIIQDLKDGITKGEFIEKYEDCDLIHINKNSTLILGSHYLVELIFDISGNNDEKMTKMWTGFWNFSSLNELVAFTKSKIGNDFRVLGGNLISITNECRDLHASIMHFYEELKKNELQKKIDETQEGVRNALP
nr:hypothetical protein [Candidatus Gracilibacteria bacterium]